jgi:hypothetical protein
LFYRRRGGADRQHAQQQDAHQKSANAASSLFQVKMSGEGETFDWGYPTILKKL